MVGITVVKQTYCRLDRKPINKSKVYRIINKPLTRLSIKLLGEKRGRKFMQKLTYEDW